MLLTLPLIRGSIGTAASTGGCCGVRGSKLPAYESPLALAAVPFPVCVVRPQSMMT
jgi:hypothetical protein